LKTVKRILAILGLVIIIGLFAATLFLAIAGSPNTFHLFCLSLIALIVVPVLIWAYTFIYRLLAERNDRPELPPDTENADRKEVPPPEDRNSSD
jgi:heme/copper-type cytochrome/quinol oxidase subunit 2